MSTPPSDDGVGVTVHLDESNAPCTRHPRIGGSDLYALAVIGSRAASFSHDVASKLQRIIMAISELDELAETNPAMRYPVEAVQSAVTELHKLFVENRAAAKPQPRVAIALDALVATAQARVGVVATRGLPTIAVGIHVSAVTHAFAQLVDLTAVISALGRTVDLTVQVASSTATLVLATPADSLATSGDTLALATYVLARSGAELRCTPDAIVLRLPLAAVADPLADD